MTAHSSIVEIDEGDWNYCFGDAIENYRYLLAVEKSNLESFSFKYLTISKNNKITAAAFWFATEYNLETTLKGFLKHAVNKIRKAFPNFLKFKLACFGSPLTENCNFGFDPTLAPDERQHYLALMIKEFESQAQSLKIKLLGIKDLSQISNQTFGEVFKLSGYSAISGMPSAALKIDFANIDEYFAKLSYGTRKDLRRKLRKLSELRIEYRTDISDIIDELYAMYLATRNRSDWQFETLTKEYFLQMQSNSIYTVYYASNRPVAVNLSLVNDQVLLDKFFCAKSEDARAYNLYFISWIENINLCLKNKLSQYQAGQACDENKTKLGCDLEPNYIYFKHQNFIINFILKLVRPLFNLSS